MKCPHCGSTTIDQGCCGDTSYSCRACRYRWEGPPAPCPVPQVPAKEVETFAVEPYKPIPDEDLWGE